MQKLLPVDLILTDCKSSGGNVALLHPAKVQVGDLYQLFLALGVVALANSRIMAGSWEKLM